ncbi:MAG TPA: hydroxymethylbilane synthase [Aestuariivirgaceae bacterium]|nr:hydroxymethylbilane synthase [Aestuariivirgaceae bacterium]
MQTAKLRIGTRGSRLARIQAQEAKDRLVAAHGLDADSVEIHIISTSGDRIQDRPLSELGGKGLFTKEIEDALLEGQIDIAVHSMKDMPAMLPEGLVISCLLPREDPRDAFISPVAQSIRSLPKGARLGSSSVRRAAQVRRLRPDVEVVNFRGNVETRLRKLDERQADATLLACAGLNRLGLQAHVTSIVAMEDMLPAVAQGAIGIEARADDARIHQLLAAVGDRSTAITIACERAFLEVLEGSCRMPIAGHAVLDGPNISFRGEVLTPDGTRIFAAARQGSAGDAAALGREAGLEVKRAAADHLVS